MIETPLLDNEKLVKSDFYAVNNSNAENGNGVDTINDLMKSSELISQNEAKRDVKSSEWKPEKKSRNQQGQKNLRITTETFH